MSKQIINDNVWRERIDGQNRHYRKWEDRFYCDIIEDYYEGLQWRNQQELGVRPYVINKFYETVEIKVAEFIPTFPKFLVSSKPASDQYDLESAAASSNLKQDVLNTLIDDERANFSTELELAYKDSFFRFGIIEVGYAAEWILNPNAPKPLLAKNTDITITGEKGRAVRGEPEELPSNERVYFKHIGAKRFRIGGTDNKYLEHCGWYGYWTWVQKDDLLSMKGVMNKSKLERAACPEPEADVETYDQERDRYKPGSVKVWHLWDNRAKVEVLVVDSPAITVFQRKFKEKRVFDFRPAMRLKTEGFYPIPPSYNWLSPQDEINEIREQLRNHRRRFIRKYQVVEGRMDDEEIEKFENGPDGAIVTVKVENAITAIQDASLDPAVTESIQTSNDDLNHITGTSDAERLVADRMTATQSNQIQGQTSVRQAKDRDRLVKWISGIGRAALMIAHDKFTIGTWIKLTSPEGEHLFGTIQSNGPAYKWVSSEDLNDGYDYNVNIDVTSLSTAALQEEKQNFLQFTAFVQQYPSVAFSPLLIREAAYRFNYRNEAVIKEMQKQALIAEMGRQQQMMQAASGGGGPNLPQPGNNGQQQMAAATPNLQERIQNQIKNQPQIRQGNG